MPDTMPGYRTVTPYLVVPDADAELSFLREAFGASELMCHRHPDGSVAHAEIEVGDSRIMLGQAGGPFGPKQAALYLWVEDVDATYAQALKAGASSESAPEDKPYGHRNAGVIDSNGITWWIASAVR